MGGNFSLHSNMDSLAEPGQKSLLSDPIEGVSAEQLLEGIEKYVRSGKSKIGFESTFEVSDLGEEGLLVKHGFEVPEMFGGGHFDYCAIYKFDHASCICSLFSYEAKDQKDCSKCYVIKIHSEPSTRVETWVQIHFQRSSDAMQMKYIKDIVKAMGASALVHMDQDSSLEKGAKSTISDPIEDGEVQAENFIEWYKGHILKGDATAVPDGSIIEEVSPPMDVLGMKKMLFKCTFKEDRIVREAFVEDETFSDLESTQYIVVHKDPFRLECWREIAAGRYAGDRAKKVLEPLIKNTLKFIQDGS